MLIKVRAVDGTETLFSVSRTTKVSELKQKVKDELDVDVDSQRLFFRGKQLENGCTLFDYDINNSNVVQLMVRVPLPPLPSEDSNHSTDSKFADEIEPEDLNSSKERNLSPAESLYFKVGDVVDFQILGAGHWVEGTVFDIKRVEGDTNAPGSSSQSAGGSVSGQNTQESGHDVSSDNCAMQAEDDGLLYFIRSFRFPADEVELPLKHVRPRASKLVPFSEVKEGQTILANCDLDGGKNRGHWYEFTVSKTSESKKRRSVYQLRGEVKLEAGASVDNIVVTLCEELYEIPPLKRLTDCTPEELADRSKAQQMRKYAAECSACNDAPGVSCDQCGCEVCKGKEDPDLTMICDECDGAYHFKCLDPPLTSVPDEDDWYCPKCRNDPNAIVRAGEQLKESKKKAKMPSKTTTKNWGGGMACVGRTSECTLVPPDHVGPIPGVEVGMSWKFRVQMSDLGVHRPVVAGMHGRAHQCAFSIVLSGGYEDDVDDGDEVVYTGSGGRNLEGNKRTAEQSEDQELTNTNKALAMNCAAPFSEKGAEAKDWQKGKPVRLIRSSKMNKKNKNHSKFAPEEGFRYDGLYKVVKYYPERGQSGFIVWRYVLRRDDPAPAPWTKAGKKRMEELDLKLIYPDGYLEELAAKEKEKALAKQKMKEALKEKTNKDDADEETQSEGRDKIKSKKGKKDNQNVKKEAGKSPKFVVKIANNKTKNKDEKKRNSVNADSNQSKGKRKSKDAGVNKDVVEKENIDVKEQNTTSRNSRGRKSLELQSKSSKKRSHSSENESDDASPSKPPASKKPLVAYTLEQDVKELIEKEANKKLWQECESHLEEGKKAYLDSVALLFQCICCQLLVNKPVTLTCLHNICKKCLQRTFSSGVYTCPMCREHLGEDYEVEENEILGKILLQLFPGYNRYRR